MTGPSQRIYLLGIGSYLLNDSARLKHQLIVIVDITEFLSCDVDTAWARDAVYSTFFEERIELVDLLIESGCANLTRAIDESDIEELSFPPLVMICFDGGFEGASCFDGPCTSVWRNSDDRVEVGTSIRTAH